MGAGNLLTTLPIVKGWLGIADDNTDADAMLSRMIKVASAFVLNYLNRDGLDLTTYSDVYDGYGNSFMVLRRNPVYQVEAVSFLGTPCPAATGNGFDNPYTNGWVLEPEYSPVGSQRLNFYGRVLPRARSSIAVRYSSGYVITDEAQTIPDASEYTITTYQLWLGDVSVKKASDGTLFTKVDANPAAGEYTVAAGVYTFNAADADTPVLITYSYVPADIVQATTEIIGERYRYMDRIGYLSKSLGGQETVTFSSSSLSEFVRESLTPYRNVAPI